MSSTARALVFLSVAATVSTGCASRGELRRSTLESSTLQLGSAERSGHPTEIIVLEEEVDPQAAIARREPLDPATTYLVLTRSEAQIVWADSLANAPPAEERAIVGRWVLPYIRAGDLDGALKAFVFGYLQALHDAALIDWDQAIVPFLPPGAAQGSGRSGGILLALLIALLVARSSGELA